MVYDLEEAIEGMESRFTPAGRELAPWPVAPGHTEEEISSVEARLGVRLPRSFRELIRRYCFLRAVAGNVAMSHAENLEEWLVSPNTDPPPPPSIRWWASGTRPGNLLLIAQSDAHSFLLDTQTGAVMAVWVDDPQLEPRAVSRSFGDFYRGLATIYLAGLGTDAAVEIADEVALAVGADEGRAFWARFAVRAA